MHYLPSKHDRIYRGGDSNPQFLDTALPRNNITKPGAFNSCVNNIKKENINKYLNRLIKYLIINTGKFKIVYKFLTINPTTDKITRPTALYNYAVVEFFNLTHTVRI